jgi:DNA repair protein RadC
LDAVRYQRAELPLKLDGLAAARRFFANCLAEQDPQLESLWVAHLDDQAHCLHLSHHQGECGGMTFPLRTIILDSAAHGSSAMLLAHNHPSGDARPSESDLGATRRLALAADALGCRVVDHLVFAGNDCTSLRSLGYL